MPEVQENADMIFSVFACTSCADEDKLIPQMNIQNGQRVAITSEFLSDYQDNFRLLLFSVTEAARAAQFEEKIAFREIVVDELRIGLGRFGKSGGQPIWMQGEEYPSALNGETSFKFGLQIAQDFQFDLIPGAPPQMDINIMGNPEPSDEHYYYLFNANALYFFFSSGEPSEIYVTTQGF